jgi:hypothetical protein
LARCTAALKASSPKLDTGSAGRLHVNGSGTGSRSGRAARRGGGGALPGVGHVGLGVHHQGQLAGEVVDDGDLFGQQQQDVGRAEGVGLAGLGQARLDVAHGVVAEAAHQAAGKARQVVARRHLDAVLELGDEVEGLQ